VFVLLFIILFRARSARIINIRAPSARIINTMCSNEPLTAPLDLPAPGRRQLLYFTLRFCRNLCFW